MVSSLRALLNGAIDYAGLFPPASLALRAAFDNYLHYRRDADAWMLGRFICPVAKLRELGPMLPPPSPNQASIRIAAIASELEQDLIEIGRFTDAARGAAVVDAIELRLRHGAKA